MAIETTVFTFKLFISYEEQVKNCNSPEVVEFHKKSGLNPIYREKSLTNPDEAIVIHQCEEGVAVKVFNDPEARAKIEENGRKMGPKPIQKRSEVD